MAEAESGPKPAGKVPKDTFAKDRLPFIIATSGEFIGLYFWLYYWDMGMWVAATIVLWAGFLTERLAVLGWVKYFHEKMQAKYGFKADGTAGNDIKEASKLGAIAHLLFICLTEITIWVAFVLVYDRYGWVAAFAVLVIGEQLEHSMELGLIARRPMREYILSVNALTITLLEAVGGIAWLWLWRHGQPQLGGAIFLVGLTIEHVVEGQSIKTNLEEPFKERQAENEAAERDKDERNGEADGADASQTDTGSAGE